jgi:hypothetical protein
MKIYRSILDKLVETIVPGKVMVIYGPRQVGKTTLVNAYMQLTTEKTMLINGDEAIYGDVLSSRSLPQLKSLIGDAALLIIDEAQRIENIGINLKIIVDNFPSLKIIATGSASFELANRISEPLTGRKLTFNLYPVSFFECEKTFEPFEARRQLERWLIWGGYPEVVATSGRNEREAILNELVSSYLYRDVLELEDIRHASKIVDLLRLLAFQIGSEVSLSELAKSLSADFRTIERYLDLLEKVFVIYRVGGFSRNLRKEIVKNARYYFYDNGVRNALIQNYNPLDYRNDVGQLWENYLMIERQKANQRLSRHVNRYFWRTYDQKEIDYIEEYQGGLFGYEFKYTDGGIRKATKKEFLNAYPNASLDVITKENFTDFVD